MRAPTPRPARFYLETPLSPRLVPAVGNSTIDVVDPSVARALWKLLEPYHALIYFAPEARELYARAGLKGGWMGYFASRSAAMGPVPASVVTATFYNFHPRMVERAIPDAWSFSSPELVLRARYDAADRALRRLLGAEIHDDALGEAAALGRRAAEGCDPAGRALYAAHASLPWPDQAHLQLWHAATLLREHRGDGHVATLVSEGIDGCAAHVLLVATGASTAEMQKQYRGWSDQEWDAAVDRMRGRGLVDETAAFTESGRRLRDHLEQRTDDLALAPYAALGDEAVSDLEKAMTRVVELITKDAPVPYPNPMGLPAK